MLVMSQRFTLYWESHLGPVCVTASIINHGLRVMISHGVHASFCSVKKRKCIMAQNVILLIDTLLHWKSHTTKHDCCLPNKFSFLITSIFQGDCGPRTRYSLHIIHDGHVHAHIDASIGYNSNGFPGWYTTNDISRINAVSSSNFFRALRERHGAYFDNRD